MATTGVPTYDKTDPERRRLTLQATLQNPLTEAFLRRAGITTGMRVLELGSGSGDVSLLLARLVGPEGELHSIDTDTAALRTARARLRAEGLDHAIFEPIDLHDFKPEFRFDAIVGRHILLHVHDAEYVIRRAVELARPGGIIAFQEYDYSGPPAKGFPAQPMAERMLEQIYTFYQRTSPHANIGTRLYHLMHRAGLPAPEGRLESILGGGPKSPIYDWMAETYRSLAPKAAELGLISGEDAQRTSASLAGSLREEALQHQAVVVGPPMISVFGRKQSAG